jgi:hypothetical protein
VPFNEVFNPGRTPFESKEIQKALQKGLGAMVTIQQSHTSSSGLLGLENGLLTLFMLTLGFLKPLAL